MDFLKDGRNFVPVTGRERTSHDLATDGDGNILAMVRAQLGATATILANSAGAISDASLSGITIEMEACAAPHGDAARPRAPRG